MDRGNDPFSSKLGEVLIKEKIITENQLGHAIQEQLDSFEKKRLGQILVELNYVTPSQLREISKKYNIRQPLGELLIENKIVPPDKVDQAIKEHRAHGVRLGEYLIKIGALSEEQLTKIISQQINIPFIIPNKRLADRKLFEKYPLGLLKQFSILPLLKNEDTITLLVHDPFDREMLRTVKTSFGDKIDIAISPKTMIDKVISELSSERAFLSQSASSPATEESSINNAFQRYDLDKVSVTSSPSMQAIALVDYIILNAIQQGASDIHIDSMYNKLRVRHRIDGELLYETDLPKIISDGFIRRIKILSKMEINEVNNALDGNIYIKYQEKNYDLRVSLYPTVLGPSITIRFLTREIGIKSLEELGMLPRALKTLKQILDSPGGMVIFAGPTGVGKTTSLYACLHYLNQESLKICTIEAPVEYSIEGVAQCQLRTVDKGTISERVKSMLHQDPDVMVLGEISDEESAKASLEAALSGHKVFSTIHTEDSFGAVLRLMDMGMKKFLISSTGLAVIAQRLLRRICPNCKENDPSSRNFFKSYHLKGCDPDNWHFYRGKGCANCNHSGFLGRSGLFELLTINDEIRNAFLDNLSSSELRKGAQNTKNYLSLREAGFIKALQGETTIEEAFSILSYSEKQSFESIQLSEDLIKYWMGEESEKIHKS